MSIAMCGFLADIHFLLGPIMANPSPASSSSAFGRYAWSRDKTWPVPLTETGSHGPEFDDLAIANCEIIRGIQRVVQVALLTVLLYLGCNLRI